VEQRASEVVLDYEVRVEATPEVVFAHFIDPVLMTDWIAQHAELDSRPGGKVRLEVNGTDVVVGTVVEIVPNERLVFTWGWEGDRYAVPPGSSTVEVTFEKDGDCTVVHVRHSRLPAVARDIHAAGWAALLPRLREACVG